MTKYLVYVETAGDAVTPDGAVAHVPGLPGASARGNTIEEAKAKVRGAIEEYMRLLREVGESVPRVGQGIELDFEEIDGTTFPTDYDALRPNEMETLLRWMAVSRQELVDLVKNLSEEEMALRPEEGAPSIHDVLCQIAEADLWYTDRLKKWPESALFRLAASRGVALERLRGLGEKERASNTVYNGEDWNARKVMRRMLEFERESIAMIKEMLAARPSG